MYPLLYRASHAYAETECIVDYDNNSYMRESIYHLFRYRVQTHKDWNLRTHHWSFQVFVHNDYFEIKDHIACDRAPAFALNTTDQQNFPTMLAFHPQHPSNALLS